MEGLEEDIKEVDSLLSVAVRPLVRGRLALLLSDLQQVKSLLPPVLGCGDWVGGRPRLAYLGAFGLPALKPTSGDQAQRPWQHALLNRVTDIGGGQELPLVAIRARAAAAAHPRLHNVPGAPRLRSQAAGPPRLLWAWQSYAKHVDSLGQRWSAAIRSPTHKYKFNLVPGPRVAAGN